MYKKIQLKNKFNFKHVNLLFNLFKKKNKKVG